MRYIVSDILKLFEVWKQREPQISEISFCQMHDFKLIEEIILISQKSIPILLAPWQLALS